MRQLSGEVDAVAAQLGDDRDVQEFRVLVNAAARMAR
jgi:hypothetical protein